MDFQVDTDQMGPLREAQIRRAAPDYADLLIAENLPRGRDWTRAEVVEDCVEQITVAMDEFDLTHPSDVYRFLALRHSVGPDLHKLGRVRRSLLEPQKPVPAGSRILQMVAEAPASYWTKIRGQAGYEGTDTLDALE